MVQLFEKPFDLSPHTVESIYQMELIDLRNSNILKSKFMACDTIEFYRLYEMQQFPKLLDNAKKLCSFFHQHIFASNYFLA